MHPAWLPCFFLLMGLWGYWSWREGPRIALGRIVLVTMLAPVWVEWVVAGLPFDLKIAATAVALFAFCVDPRTRFRPHLTWLDAFPVVMMLIHIWADWVATGWNWGLPLRAYGEWLFPYVAARFAFTTSDEVRRNLPVALVVALVLSLTASFECVTGINLYEELMGARPVDASPRDLTRFGLKRAFGPDMHSIFFGIAQLTLLPWCLYAADRASRSLAPKSWKRSPWMTGIGMLAALSRTPWLGLATTVYAYALLRYSTWRRLILATGVSLVVVGALAFPLVKALVATIGEDHVFISRLFGKRTETSTAHNRLYIWQVYGPAMAQASWLGYGTDATSFFPPRVPMRVEHRELLPWTTFVDNQFILTDLRFGHLGLVSFVALLVAGAVAYARLALRTGQSGQAFHSASFGVALSMPFMLMFVWMPHDFGFYYLWLLGIASGLETPKTEASKSNPQPARAPPPPPIPVSRPHRPEAEAEPGLQHPPSRLRRRSRKPRF